MRQLLAASAGLKAGLKRGPNFTLRCHLKLLSQKSYRISCLMAPVWCVPLWTWLSDLCFCFNTGKCIKLWFNFWYRIPWFLKDEWSCKVNSRLMHTWNERATGNIHQKQLGVANPSFQYSSESTRLCSVCGEFPALNLPIAMKRFQQQCPPSYFTLSLSMSQ